MEFSQTPLSPPPPPCTCLFALISGLPLNKADLGNESTSMSYGQTPYLGQTHLLQVHSGVTVIQQLYNPTILRATITILMYTNSPSIIRQPPNPTLFSSPIECRTKVVLLYMYSIHCILYCTVYSILYKQCIE